MKKSTWVIEIMGNDSYFWWALVLRSKPSIRLILSGDTSDYTTRRAAILGGERMAKRLRINAEVER